MNQAHIVQVFPYGVKMSQKGLVLGFKKGGGLRGEIDGFSAKAASRLREFCVTMEVPGRVPVAVTLTTHGTMTSKAWRKSWKRFRMRARAVGVPFVYRVELQKRKTPHVHCTAWMDAQPLAHPEHRRLFTEGWLECVEEQADPDSRRHAVKLREIPNEGWAVYQALHDGKHKREQLGWEGKQWGIVGGHAFKRRDSEDWHLTDSQRSKFQRVMRRLLRRVDRPNAFERAVLAWCPALEWRPKKFSAQILPSRRNWLRCVGALTVNRVLRWVCDDDAMRRGAS